MTYTERLRNAAQLVDDPDIAALIMMAADRIDQLNMWKVQWAKLDHAYAELNGRYNELKEQFDNYKRNHEN